MEGWKNLVTKTGFDLVKAQKRAEICASCPHFSAPIGIPICTACGCPIAAKTKAPGASCPKNLWTSYKHKNDESKP